VHNPAKIIFSKIGDEDALLRDSATTQHPGEYKPVVGNSISSAGVWNWTLCINWINSTLDRAAGTPLFVCGASSAFLGLLAMILGLTGLFSRDRSRATAAAGLVLGFIGFCLFIVVLNMIQSGG
jgi:hypothetical protein